MGVQINRKKGFEKSIFLLEVISVAIAYIPRIFFKHLYSNIEIALYRYAIFFLGACIAPKIYKKQKMSIADYVLLNIGLIMMIISKIGAGRIFTMIGWRYLIAFYAISLLFYLVKLLEILKIPIIFKILSSIGNVSFELYLSHVSLREIFKALGIRTENFVCYIAVITFSVIASFAVYKLEEKVLNEQ